MSAEIIRTCALPRLREALERRYPGVTVSFCEWREHDDGTTGATITFDAPLETLLRHGLAQHTRRRGVGGELSGGDGLGGQFTGCRHSDGAYVVHHQYDRDPRMAGKRTWPPKWVEKEVARIWRRISKSAPLSAAGATMSAADDNDRPALTPLTPTIGLEEAGKLLRCHPDTVRRMAKAGEIPGTKVGRSWVFYTQRLLEWLDKRCAAQQQVLRSATSLNSGGSALAQRLRRRAEERLRGRGESPYDH